MSARGAHAAGDGGDHEPTLTARNLVGKALDDTQRTVLWRLARDHSFRPRPARNGRWREDRKIGVAARQAIEADLAIPYGCKLTAQETWWRPMLGGRPEGVNNTDARARLERGDEIVEQGVRLCDS